MHAPDPPPRAPPSLDYSNSPATWLPWRPVNVPAALSAGTAAAAFVASATGWHTFNSGASVFLWPWATFWALAGLSTVVLGFKGLVQGHVRPLWRGVASLALAVFVLTLALNATAQHRALRWRRETREGEACLTRLRIVGAAITQYRSHNDGRFPPRLEGLVAAGLLSTEALRCPSHRRDDPAPSYVYVGAALLNPEPHAVVAYEWPSRHKGFFHGGRALTADGHVDILAGLRGVDYVASLRAAPPAATLPAAATRPGPG